MIGRMRQWMSYRWMRWQHAEVIRAYQITFSTAEGQVVIRHLMDGIYCQPCLSKDPYEQAAHNGARALIHGILEKIDMGEYPGKYALHTVEGVEHGRG